jgi:flagellar FliL protein
MSAAAAAAEVAPPKKRNKKLIVIGAVVALVLAAGGGGAVFYLKKKAAHAAEAAEGEESATAAPSAAPKRDPKAVPTFVPLDTFTVNLADRDAERYAQVGITLEVDDAKTGDLVKTFMPAIRNNILMALADKTAAQLNEREGKLKLAEQVRRETSRALGVDVPEPLDGAAPGKPGAEVPRKPAVPAPELPIRAVHFSNFIIQ